MEEYNIQWMVVTDHIEITDENITGVEHVLDATFPDKFRSYIKSFHGHYASSCNHFSFTDNEGNVIKSNISMLHSFNPDDEYKNYITNGAGLKTEFSNRKMNKTVFIRL